MSAIPVPLIERMPTPTKFEIVEGKENGVLKVRGRFQMADTQNGNGRVYPGKLWERILKDEGIQSAIKERRMLGHTEHPKDGLTDLSSVSHVITGLRMEGKEIIGEAEILPTPSGRIIETLLRRDIPVGVSSRGKGSSESKDGVEHVKPDDYVLETFDFVFAPSTPGAFASISETLKGAERADAPIGEKIEAVCGYARRAGEIKRLTSGASLDELRRHHSELVEAEVAVHNIRATAPDAQKTNSLFTETVGKVVESRRLVEKSLGRVAEAESEDDEKKDKKDEAHKDDCSCPVCAGSKKSEYDKKDGDGKDAKKDDDKDERIRRLEAAGAVKDAKYERALGVISALTSRNETLRATTRGLEVKLKNTVEVAQEMLRRRKHEALARRVVIDESVAKPSTKATAQATKRAEAERPKPSAAQGEARPSPKPQIEESALPDRADASAGEGDRILAKSPLDESAPDQRVQACRLALSRKGWA